MDIFRVRKYRSLGWAGLALLAVAAGYSPLARAGFVYDDQWTVVRNPALRTWDIPSFFLDARTVAIPGSGMAQDIYRPLATLSLALDYHFWGLHPLPYHLVNLLLHLLNGVLFWRLARRWLPDQKAALISAGIFLCHPVQIETVAWITQRSTLLCALGCLVSLEIVSQEQALSRSASLAGVSAWALGIFSKETGTLVPGLAALLDWTGTWKIHLAHEVSRRRSLYMAWLILAAPYWLMRWRALGEWSSVAASRPSMWVQWSLGAMAFPMYLGKLVVPVGLRVSYDTPAWDPLRLSVSAMISALFLAIWGWTLYRRHFLAVCMGWIFLTLLPVLHVIPIVPFFAERFLYLPVMGCALFIGWMAARWERSRTPITVWLVGLWTITCLTVPVWRSDTALWKQAVRSEPTNAFAHACLAQSLGDAASAEEEYFKVLVNQPSEGIRYAAFKNLAYLNHRWRNNRKADYWRKKAAVEKPSSLMGE